MQNFTDYGIDTKGKRSGEVKTLCPQCSSARKKAKEPCLNVNVSDGVWHCHNCGWKGSLGGKSYVRPQYTATPTVTDKALEWFKSRGITEPIIERNRLTVGKEWMPHVESEMTTIQFPYIKNGEVVNVKYRTGDKHFKMAKDAERTLYGYDDIAETLIWVEGEMDKLSCEVAGVQSCVSVPNGASDKLDFLADCEKALESVEKHIIAVDSDDKGKVLEKELTRRLGPEKCWTVTWPDGCKDANDVLMVHGADEVQRCIEAAKPCPVEGLFTVFDLTESVIDLHINGAPRGMSTGYLKLDRHYRPHPGHLTVITGVPGTGKSEFVESLALNMARYEGARFALFSPEHRPVELHLSRLLKKRVGKSFFGGGRMDRSEVMSGLAWLNDHFYFVMPEEDCTLDSILARARVAVFRHGVNGLIIDPWNQIEHRRPSAQTETEYIGECLTKILRFAWKCGVHVWLIAHPTKVQKDSRGQYPVVRPYDISGSSNWWNKADNIISLYRNLLEPSPIVQAHIQKIKWDCLGSPGMVEFEYDITTGRYS